MSYETMYPKTRPLEDKIKLLLVMKGYKRADIHFRDSSHRTKEDGRYIRNGYWEHIEDEDIQYVSELCKVAINEFSFYDEDCGWNYCYDIIK